MCTPLSSIVLTCFVLLIVIAFSGCYRMPTENDFSTVPTTNNPSVTCEKNDPLLPKLGY